MTIRLLRGDCRVTLNSLEAGSVQTCVTSPPYYGLRSYGTPDLVWGGDAECAHEWRRIREFHNRGDATAGAKQKTNNGAVTDRGQIHYGCCPCGAWAGSLGLEPIPELYVEHLVECFREVWRVLSPTGTLWVNLGDSYAGSGNGSNDHRENGSSLSKNDLKYIGQKPGRSIPAKNLMMMPSRLAMALQVDGWILRSMMPWVKRSAMPESVTDRPSTAVEYWFLFSKQARYYWDADAVRHEISQTTLDHNSGGLPHRTGPNGLDTVQRSVGNGSAQSLGVAAAGRNRRNSDWFFESWQGMLLDDQDEPIALVVNPAGFSGAHFATFPPKLIEPMVKASSRPGDTVLDPFAGAGTTLLVADRLGRNAIGCELSDSYGEMATDRLVGDSPMFTEVVA